jgi:hypothetical protein
METAKICAAFLKFPAAEAFDFNWCGMAAETRRSCGCAGEHDVGVSGVSFDVVIRTYIYIYYI